MMVGVSFWGQGDTPLHLKIVETIVENNRYLRKKVLNAILRFCEIALFSTMLKTSTKMAKTKERSDTPMASVNFEKLKTSQEVKAMLRHCDKEERMTTNHSNKEINKLLSV